MSNERPSAATGHLLLRTTDARSAATRLCQVGVREIAIRDGFAVLELRGGTHIVVRQVSDDGLMKAPFDLMFDDLDATHQSFRAHGFTVTPIEQGRIHRSFDAVAPEGFQIRIVDSHVGQRVV